MSTFKLKHENLPAFTVAKTDSQKLGVDNIKIILTVAIAFFTDLITAIRKRNYLLLINIVANLLKYGNIVVIAQDAWEEFKDTSQPESAEIIMHIQTELDLENEDLEDKIEKALAVIPEVYDLVLSTLNLAARGKDIYDRVVALFGKKGALEEAA
jgi:hypothetical protein